MTYKQIKWMILLIPTLTVGLWEYVRHQFLLPYISMNLGNWLTPVIVYVVSITLLSRMFHMLEQIQAELERERTAKAALEAREQLAKELHDGIAQSLFLLSVKVDRLEGHTDEEQHRQEIYQIRKTVHEVNRYVRQAIADLKYEPASDEAQLANETLAHKVKKMAADVHVDIAVDWVIPEEAFNAKEKVELLACIREAVVNIEKHAAASNGWIQGTGDKDKWTVEVKDNGRGYETDPFQLKDRYGLNIMKERAEAMSWSMQLNRVESCTVVELSKAGETR